MSPPRLQLPTRAGRHRPANTERVRSLLLLGLVSLAAAFAQSSRVTGGLQGLVLDQTGAAVSDAAIVIQQAESGFERAAVSDAAGSFLVQGLPSGAYRLRVEKAGFGTVVVEGINISLGQTARQKVELKPAAVTESIDVTADANAVDTTSTSLSAALGSERIEEAPSSNRNFLNFVLVAPGVAPSSGSNAQRSLAGVRSAALDSGFTFGGMRGRNNSLTIDGVDNRDETTGGNRVAIGLEMVQEFRVAGANLSAEFSGAAGGAVNVVTRSGNNLWHGDATWFFQNEALNARDPEVISGPSPRFRNYQPGVSVLGPLRRDRTFFATALEQRWESEEEWSDTPSGALESIRQTLERPEYQQAGFSAETGLFPATSSETEFSLKLDHQLATAHSLTARYAYSRGRVSGSVHGLDNFADRSARGSSLTRDHSFVAALTSVPRPNLVNDLRLQLSRRDVELQPNSRGAMLHIPGVVTLGQAYNLNADRIEDHWEIIEGLNVILGRHQLGFGGGIHRVTLDAGLAHRFGGIFIFPTLEDFEQARPDVFLQAFGQPQTEFSTLPGGLWIQDRWQALPGLSVEAGLRWDAQRLPSPIAGPTANFAPRFGLAWTPLSNPPPEKTLVLRAGLGWFYDRYPLAFLNDALQKDGLHGFEQYFAGAAAVRALALGQGAPLAAPLASEPTSIYRADPRFPTTYSRKITTGLEQGLGSETKLTVEYLAVRGFHLPRVRNLHGSLPALYQLEQTSRSSYRGVSVSVQRRLVREMAFLVAYNYSHTRDDASDFDEHPLDPFNFTPDWALSRQHQAHRLAASGLFEIPAEDWKAAPGWLREGLEDVILAPILTVGSGRPVNALETTDTLRTGAFPISARPAGLGRNPFLAPGTVNLDLRIMKGFWVKEGRAILQFGVEAFNLLNHSNPLRVSPYFAAGTAPLPSYRDRLETLNPRQLQLLVQFEY